LKILGPYLVVGGRIFAAARTLWAAKIFCAPVPHMMPLQTKEQGQW
jgi:hypothetical protein